ncbi:MAG: heterodisulfide reductase-related iron-sulfur binding cluster, partial [Actinomycetota bacterium]
MRAVRDDRGHARAVERLDVALGQGLEQELVAHAARRIAQSLARLLGRAGLSFAILGPREQCTGDPARRMGNEFLFQTLAERNVETLNGAGVTTIVTN